jgi:hypothetical protein
MIAVIGAASREHVCLVLDPWLYYYRISFRATGEARGLSLGRFGVFRHQSGDP